MRNWTGAEALVGLHGAAVQLDELTRISADDLLRAFGLGDVRRGRAALSLLCCLPARRFARRIAAFDQRAGEVGLRAAAADTLPHFVRRLRVSGQDFIPASGPLLVVSNHPGLADALALFASIPRDDLLTLAADRPFLRALPNVGRHINAVRDDVASRSLALRATARHLRAGGALLTFPAGAIEPDPAVLPGAAAALERWSESVALFARLAPEAQIVPALVSGVLSARALTHPLTRLRRAQKDREWLGATLQLLVPAYQPPLARLSFGPPIAAGAADTVIASMRALLVEAAPYL